MLFLLLPLLAVLPGGGNADGLKEPVSFHVIQIASFYNHSWKRDLVSGYLGDLQTHTLDRNSSTIIFLWPWSRGNFSNEEWKQLEMLLHIRLVRFLEGMHRYSREMQFECILWPPFFLPYNQILKPEAWLSRGLSPGPGHLQLVCHVSGFYPKPVWVMWMRGEQEQQGIQRGDILPNADGTWSLRTTLEVAAGEAAGLSCRVKHSSLEGQDIVLYWEHHSSMGLIILAVIVPLLLLIGLAFWFRKR
ncbi:PREDICTED: T-cell surface glycoprotein CD1a-like, partial [Mandrillus leucophaeus]|uniref:T-cell surface glycoprotein CD1a-like n=1 Tax=Mandrillus leucophaeus TaxID=9568 RepID=UPI0005F412B7